MAAEMSVPRPEDRLRKQRAMLADFGLRAIRAENLDELLQEATELVSQGLEVALVKILERRPEQGDLLIRAGVNWKPGVVGHATLAGDGGSPAGYAIAREGCVISPDLATETRFAIPPLLTEHGVRSMVNVAIVGEHEPFGVLEVDSPRPRAFDDDDIAFLRTYANLIAAAVDRVRSRRALEEIDGTRRLLMRELQHRVKNLLALVQAVAALTTTEGRTAEEFREALMARLDALARAHGLLSEQQSGAVDLGSLIERLLEPYRLDRPDAVTIEGPQVTVLAKQALTLGLMLHELATNAAKYGSLSVPEGRVQVSWALSEGDDGPNLQLLWRERDGPRVEPPDARGFGSRMIERAVAHELDGHADLEHAPDGLYCEIAFPLSQAADQGN